MKLIIKEYLASLRERNELDAVLPDMLTELGFQVYSRPSRGTRQYGVDIAALGTDEDGARKVYLFSVKSGNLTRSEWNSASSQSLRPSLDEIIDHYVDSRIPAEYRTLPIVICLCFGGDIDEQVRAEVTGYIKRNETGRIKYEQWNGDKLAELILSGLLREEILPAPLRAHLRKSAAMVEEPDISIEHFRALVSDIVKDSNIKGAERLARARLVNICLWILYGWAREAGNIEAAYIASEFSVLEMWQYLHEIIEAPTAQATDASLILNSLIELHFGIWDEFYRAKLRPHVGARHAIASAVSSHVAVDVNLKLFEVLGRTAQRALWEAWRHGGSGHLPARLPDDVSASLDERMQELVAMISNNQVLLSPIADAQVIDISTALTLFACRAPFSPTISDWLKGITDRLIFNYHNRTGYPTSASDYWELVEHPGKTTDEHRTEATEASVLLPTLALWANAVGNQEVSDQIAAFKQKHLAHCNFQLWLPGSDSDSLLYSGRGHHGAALSHIPVIEEANTTLDFVRTECERDTAFDSLSAIRLGHWPIVVMACRHYRLPLPPQLWLTLFAEMASGAPQEATPSLDVGCSQRTDKT
ncbi:chemotaxis protein [Burkholderia stabilis]|uniref:chemotaxis protein n=1 Tax=Burkholderia stabilis TaxID=95485 RepID=UPI00158A788F|nr:chemotaxis protein [Burkholderia stabilis]